MSYIDETPSTGLAVNFILIESLQRFYQFYGDELQVRGVEQHRNIVSYLRILG